MMTPHVILRLDGEDRHFEPNDELRGQFAVSGCRPEDVRAIECSVLWHTEGKGDEDLGVHFFERLGREDGTTIQPTRPRTFVTRLPASPLSYEGVIVRIHWCARARVFLRGGKELVAEQPFQLGHVPAAKLIRY